jgi:hypothetical protein
LAFIFEGLCVLDLEFDGEKGDHSSRQPSALSHQLTQSTNGYPRLRPVDTKSAMPTLRADG